MKPILIQGAENSEINYFLEILKNKNEVEIGSFKFWTGEIFNLPIVVSRTKVGEINCAIATTIGILKFEPRCIINQGTAGSHSIDIHRGDIIVGEKYVNICNFQINYAEKGEYTNINRWNLKSYYSDDDKIISNNADLKLIEILKIIKNNIDEKLIFGTIGSGDIWNREVDRILYLHEKYGTLCELEHIIQQIVLEFQLLEFELFLIMKLQVKNIIQSYQQIVKNLWKKLLKK